MILALLDLVIGILLILMFVLEYKKIKNLEPSQLASKRRAAIIGAAGVIIAITLICVMCYFQEMSFFSMYTSVLKPFFRGVIALALMMYFGRRVVSRNELTNID